MKEQLEFFNIPSPCIGVCSTDERGYCKGCMRKREERFNWLNFTPREQKHIIHLCRQRYRRKMMKDKINHPQEDDSNGPQESLFD
ncbi:DUF1289 domain-containing protein [Vibrio astriarenae]|uniref:DUF1289 domain-containing protein n=1 Tax=Vibrio agarivorans TaxID=153622 RepID=A0ABT7XYU7_9VIBR|nr:DUF1289 domain-containing protein [Vibrio agarivorans]MDN2480945.1 DUF1289 domain-containing protein [Vibrio agarivorans]MDN3663129.1 DUF1289 domain-containing protein [Vibrio agarivorans]